MQAHKLPPGPRYSLLSRTARQLLTNQFDFFLSTAREFGGISYVRVGPIRFCLVTGADFVHDILVKQYQRLEKGAAYHIARTVLGNGLLTSDGEAHLRQRRLCQPAFRGDRIKRYTPTITDCADSVRSQLEEGTLDIFPEMSRLTLAVASRTLFNARTESQSEEVSGALTDVMQSWNWRNVPVARVLQRFGVPYRGSRSLRRARQRLNDILYNIITDHRASGEDGDDLLSMMIHAVDEEGDGKSMTNTELYDQSMTMFLAGFETIATTLTWLWYLVSQHPEVEARLHDEVDSVLQGRLPVHDDAQRLVYTRQVFAETMRLYPAVWLMSRQATEDVATGPYVIPRGTHILFCPFVTHRNPEYFTDPELFNPDRWAGDAEQNLPEMAYYPFGGGVRRCMGEPFAWVEGPLIVSILAQTWKMSLVPDHPIALRRGFIIRPKYGMKMTLRKRVKDAVAQPVAAGTPS